MLVEVFEATAASIVVQHRGRLIKTIGDEVLFVDQYRVPLGARTIETRADLSARQATLPTRPAPTGVFAKYAALVTSASEGAVTRPRHPKQEPA